MFSGDLNRDARSDFILARVTPRGTSLDVLINTESGALNIQSRNVAEDLESVSGSLSPPADLIYVDGIHTTTMLHSRSLLVVWSVRSTEEPPFFYLIYDVDDSGHLTPRLSSVRFTTTASVASGECETSGRLSAGTTWVGVASSSYPFLVDATGSGYDSLLMTFQSGLQVVSFGENDTIECGAFMTTFPLSNKRHLSWWNPATWFSRGSKNSTNVYESKPLVESVKHPKKVRHFPLTQPDPVDVPLSRYVLPRHHSSALVDVNGDCHADLALEVATPHGREIHLYLSTPDGFERSSLIIPLPAGAHYLTWTDLDGDGATDFVFAVCDTSEPPVSGANTVASSLYKEYHQCAGNSRIVWSQALGLRNLQQTVPTSWVDTLERVRDTFGATQSVVPCEPHAVAFSAFLAVDLATTNPNFANIGLPLRLLAVDLDASGYPDLLFPVVDVRNAY